jgi:hypothetical protein
LSDIKQNKKFKNNIMKISGVGTDDIPKFIKEIALNTSTSDSLIYSVSKDNLPRASLINMYMKTFRRDKMVDYTRYINLDPTRKIRHHKNLKLPKISITQLETNILPEKMDIYKNLKADDLIGLSKLKKPKFKY